MSTGHDGYLDRRAFIKGAAASGIVGLAAGMGFAAYGTAYAADKQTASGEAASSSSASGSVSASTSASASASATGSAATSAREGEVTSWVDAVSSASVNSNKYTNYTIDELDEAINSYAIECTVATVNEDGSPNIAIFTPAMFEKKYLGFGWGGNQTKLNFDRQKIGIICFDAPDMTNEKKELRHKGAKVKAALVEDQKVLDKLRKDHSEYGDFIALEVIDVLPLA